MIRSSTRSAYASYEILVIGLLISQVTVSRQCILPCNVNIGLDTGCCPKFGLSVGGCSPDNNCCSPLKGLLSNVISKLGLGTCGCNALKSPCTSSCSCLNTPQVLETQICSPQICSPLNNAVGCSSCCNTPKLNLCDSSALMLGSTGCCPSSCSSGLSLGSTGCCPSSCSSGLSLGSTGRCPSSCSSGLSLGSTGLCPSDCGSNMCLPYSYEDMLINPQVIEYGPLCPPPRLPNLPYQVESPCDSCLPCEQYNYEIQKPYCKPCNCEPLLNLPPAIVEIPVENPTCLCESYKYDIVKPPACKTVECEKKLNLPYWTEVPCSPPSGCNNVPVCDCNCNYPYVIQQATQPKVDETKCLNIGYTVESPAPQPQPCFSDLKAKVDRILVPRKCPCICDPTLKKAFIRPYWSKFWPRRNLPKCLSNYWTRPT